MADTFHHGRRWRTSQRYLVEVRLPHAPGWFKHMLNRLYRRKADREVIRHGEVVTKKPQGADWLWW